MSDPLPAPWDIRAAELFERDGLWADFAAWEEWFRERDADADALLDRLMPADHAVIYCACVAILRGPTQARSESASEPARRGHARHLYQG